MSNLELLNKIRKRVGDYYQEDNLYAINKDYSYNKHDTNLPRFEYSAKKVKDDLSKYDWYLHCSFDKGNEYSTDIDLNLEKLDSYLAEFLKYDKNLETYKKFKKYLLKCPDLEKYIIEQDIDIEDILSDRFGKYKINFCFKSILLINYIQYMIDINCKVVFVAKKLSRTP